VLKVLYELAFLAGFQMEVRGEGTGMVCEFERSKFDHDVEFENRV
jgi:hypothetical protein